MPLGAPLASVRQRATNAFRATFTIPPKALDAASYDDATNPDNWTIVPLVGASYGPPVVRVDVVAGDALSVDLYLLTEVEPRATYQIVASSAIRIA